MTFPADLHRGQLWTTSRNSVKADNDGNRPRARCESRNRFGIECGAVIEVPWEDIPRVQDGLIVHCLGHRSQPGAGDVLTAEQVQENVKARRAEWDARNQQRKAA